MGKDWYSDESLLNEMGGGVSYSPSTNPSAWTGSTGWTSPDSPLYENQGAVPINPTRNNPFLMDGTIDPWGYVGNNAPAAISGNYGTFSPAEMVKTAAYNARSSDSSSGASRFGGYGGSGGSFAGKMPAAAPQNPYVNDYLTRFNPANLPTLKAMPTLNYTKFDENAARKAGYKSAAPYIGKLQRIASDAVTKILGGPRTPWAISASRGAISGVGEGIDSAQATGAKYGYETQMAKTRLANDAEFRQYGADVAATNYENQLLQNQYNMTYQAALAMMKSQG